MHDSFMRMLRARVARAKQWPALWWATIKNNLLWAFVEREQYRKYERLLFCERATREAHHTANALDKARKRRKFRGSVKKEG